MPGWHERGLMLARMGKNAYLGTEPICPYKHVSVHPLISLHKMQSERACFTAIFTAISPLEPFELPAPPYSAWRQLRVQQRAQRLARKVHILTPSLTSSLAEAGGVDDLVGSAQIRLHGFRISTSRCAMPAE